MIKEIQKKDLSAFFGEQTKDSLIVDIDKALSTFNYVLSSMSISCIVVDDLRKLETQIPELNGGTIAIVSSLIVDGKEELSSRTAYALVKEENGIDGHWEAFNGNYNAKNVYFDHNITLAGEYDKVGNVSMSDKKLESSGMSLDTLITKIFTKELPGSITAYPSVKGAILTGKKNGTSNLTANASYEYGTYITDLNFSGGTIDSIGSYTYGPTTTISITSWSTTATNSVNITEGAKSNTGKLENILLGDDGTHKTNPTLAAYKTVKSVQVTESGSYAADTKEALTNLGNTNTAAGFDKVLIPADTKSTKSGTISGFRCPFWGTKTKGNQIDFSGTVSSKQIRDLGQGNDTTKFSSTLPTDKITVLAGTYLIIFACKKDTDNYKKISVTDVTNPKAPFTIAFDTLGGKVKVEGANGYNAVDYDIFTVTLGEPYPSDAILDIQWSN